MEKKTKKYIYIAAPYTIPDPIENTHKACKIADELVKKGYVPVIPHLSFVWHLISPKETQFWYDYTMDLMKLCDAVLRVEGESMGADREVEMAQKIGMKVYYNIDEIE